MAFTSPFSAFIAARVVASLLGAYLFSWGVVTLGITTSVALGAGYDQAYLAFRMLGFLVLLGAFLWAYLARSLLFLFAVLFGGGAVLTAVAWAIQSRLV